MAEPDKARAELIPDQLTLIARFDAIELALAEMRNLIIGRGVAPIGSKGLAELAGQAQEAWRAIRDRLLADMLPHPYDTSATLEHWERKVNEIAARAAGEGLAGAEKIQVTHTVTSPGDAVEIVERRIVDVGSSLTVAAGTMVVGLGLLWLLLNRGGR